MSGLWLLPLLVTVVALTTLGTVVALLRRARHGIEQEQLALRDLAALTAALVTSGVDGANRPGKRPAATAGRRVRSTRGRSVG